MLSIPRSELVPLLTKYGQCRFPSLCTHAIKLRKKHREDAEFRAKMVAHNRRIAKTKKYSPEKYKKMQEHGRKVGSCPIINAKRTKKKNFKKPPKTQFYPELFDRPNDYAGVISMSDYASL